MQFAVHWMCDVVRVAIIAVQNTFGQGAACSAKHYEAGTYVALWPAHETKPPLCCPSRAQTPSGSHVSSRGCKPTAIHARPYGLRLCTCNRLLHRSPEPVLDRSELRSVFICVDPGVILLRPTLMAAKEHEGSIGAFLE